MVNTTLVVSLEVVPLPNMAEPYFMVLFHAKALEANTIGITAEKGKKSEQDQKNQLIAQLQKELQQTREDILEITEVQGYLAFISDKPEQTVDNILQDTIDLVMLDQFIYGVSGIEVCKELKENETTAHVPILMMSALSGVKKNV